MAAVLRRIWGKGTIVSAGGNIRVLLPLEISMAGLRARGERTSLSSISE